MGIVFRQSVKTTLVILAGAVLGALVNIGYTYILSQLLQGVIKTIIYQSAFIQLIIACGTTSMLLTYLPRYEPGNKRKVLISIATIAPLAATCLLLIPYFMFRENVISLYKPGEREYINQYYVWVPVMFLLWCYMSQLEYYLITHYKAAISSFMREVVLKVLNLVLIALMWLGYINFSVFVIGSILIYAVPSLLMIPIAMRTESFGFSFQWNVFSRQEYRELLRFSWYHLLLGISANALGVIDIYLLPILSRNGLASVAVYGIAVFIAAIMTAPFRAISSASISTLNLAYSSGDMARLRDLFQRSSVNILIVSVAMVVLIGCNLHNVLLILGGKEGYGAIIPLTLIMMIGRLVDMASGLNTELISISKYYKFNFRISLFLVLVLIGSNMLLIPRFDIYGAAWASSISLLLFNIGKMIFVWVKMKLQPFSSKTLVVLLMGAAAVVPGYFLPHIPDFFLDISIRSFLIIAVYGGMILWLKPSADLQVYLQSIKDNKRLF